MNNPSLFIGLTLSLMIWSCESIPEAGNTEVKVCYSDSVSYTKDVLPIFEANCFSCHNEEKYAAKADGNKMYNYDHIKGYIDEGLVLGNIKHQPGYLKMPYKREKLDSCSIAIIEKWIKSGYVKN